MTNPNLDLLLLASKIGDHRESISVVGKSKEDTIKNLLAMFEGKNEQCSTKTNNKSAH